MNKAQRIGKSVLIGAVSGFVGSWVMNHYWTAEGKLKSNYGLNATKASSSRTAHARNA